jgi:hypothetical protein
MKISNSALKKQSLLLALTGAVSLAYAGDPQLMGCWRSQHSEQHMPDQKVRHLNSDCVFEIGEKQGRSECEFKTGRTSTTFDYEVVAPGRYVITNNKRDAGKPDPTPREVEYRIDGDWMILTSRPDKRAGSPQSVPNKVVGLVMKVVATPGADSQIACHPRGPSAVRVNYVGPPSSLVLSAPDGYAPVLGDPSTDMELAQAINSNFLVGQFAANDPVGLRNVLVLDDYKVGAKPMKPADFAEFKKAIVRELGRKTSCEDAQKICFNNIFVPQGTKSTAGRYITTIFLNVKGRVAMIHGAASGPASSASKMAERAAHAFAEQLLIDNP